LTLDHAADYEESEAQDEQGRNLHLYVYRGRLFGVSRWIRRVGLGRECRTGPGRLCVSLSIPT
jgi:hypothetical protein